MDQILVNTQALIETTFYSGGTAILADDDVAVSIYSEAAGTVIASGNAIAGTAAYSYTIPPQEDLSELEATWTGLFAGVEQHVITRIEVVGGFYVSLNDIRALDGLSSDTKFTTDMLREKRRWFEDRAEGFCGMAFVPRFAKDTVYGSSAYLRVKNLFPRRLLRVSVDDANQDISGYELTDTGRLIGPTLSGQRVTIAYEHGKDEPPPRLREVALSAIRYKLLGDRSGIPERATTMTTDVGAYTLSLAGSNRPTGIPEVDSVLLDLRQVAPMVA